MKSPCFVLFFCFSAGVGRTGTYISIDTQLERARAEGILDVHNFVQLMRTQRVNMVQSFVSPRRSWPYTHTLATSLFSSLPPPPPQLSSSAYPQVYTDPNPTVVEEEFFNSSGSQHTVPNFSINVTTLEMGEEGEWVGEVLQKQNTQSCRSVLVFNLEWVRM